MPEAKINHGRLAQLDLNLLIALDAIYCEQSVTEAAKVLDIKQSSMSRQLSRLREIFRDDLFVRTPSGMTPTPRGNALAKRAREILAQVEQRLLTETAFDPASSTRVFRLGLPSYLERALLPRLVELCRTEAPHSRLRLSPIDRFSVSQLLDEGTIDIAVGPASEGGLLHKRRVLFDDKYVCLFHPKFFKTEAAISREAYLTYPHVVVDSADGSSMPIDSALGKLAERRKIVLTTSNVHTVPDIVSQFASLATVPKLFGVRAAKFFGLCWSPVPFDVPALQLSLVWHASSDQDKGMNWLRSILTRVSAAAKIDAELEAARPYIKAVSS